MMNTKVRILLGFVSIAVIIIIASYLFTHRVNQDTLVSVSTDKQEYYKGDTIHISIDNLGDHSIDIYCPSWCALGNFPTTVERYFDGQWQYFAGFCPSIEPLFRSGVLEGDYIRHTLAARSSFDLAISNFEALHLEQDAWLRIVYYIGIGNIPIYSNEFNVNR